MAKRMAMECMRENMGINTREILLMISEMGMVMRFIQMVTNTLDNSLRIRDMVLEFTVFLQERDIQLHSNLTILMELSSSKLTKTNIGLFTSKMVN